jgi:2-(1,2-epoxy-1,2-dihydrophenyl)acetyl-CoA isomerase
LELAQLYAESPPIAFALTKSIFARGLEEMIRAEIDLQPLAWMSEDHEEGKRAFRERRKPRFEGR